MPTGARRGNGIGGGAARQRNSSLLASARQLQALVRPRSPRHLRVQGLGRDIGAVRPRYSAPVHEETAEVVQILQWLKHRSLEPRPEVDRSFGSIAKDDVDPIGPTVLSLGDARERTHERSLL